MRINSQYEPDEKTKTQIKAYTNHYKMRRHLNNNLVNMTHILVLVTDEKIFINLVLNNAVKFKIASNSVQPPSPKHTTISTQLCRTSTLQTHTPPQLNERSRFMWFS